MCCFCVGGVFFPTLNVVTVSSSKSLKTRGQFVSEHLPVKFSFFLQWERVGTG